MKHALRHRPDHIVVGEVRGGEAADLLQALNTGHGGSLTIVHANNAESALSRLASCAMQGGRRSPVGCHIPGAWRRADPSWAVSRAAVTASCVSGVTCWMRPSSRSVHLPVGVIPGVNGDVDDRER